MQGGNVKKRFDVRLSAKQRKELDQSLRGGRASVLELRRKQALLLSDLNGPALPDEEIAQALRCNENTIANIRKNFVERGLYGAIGRKKQAEPSRKPTFDGEKEAHIIAIACSKKSEDDSGNWSLRLIANRMVELEIVESISHETVRRLLKKRFKTSS
jgi:hypothetical protein